MNGKMPVTLSEDKRAVSHPPPPPTVHPRRDYFTGYTLPPGNPCETFTLPPPPADKKKTGPRRKLKSPLLILLS